MTDGNNNPAEKVGSIVKSKIEEFKQEVREEKQLLKEKKYK
jgi:hypothetical protein